MKDIFRYVILKPEEDVALHWAETLDECRELVKKLSKKHVGHLRVWDKQKGQYITQQVKP